MSSRDTEPLTPRVASVAAISPRRAFRARHRSGGRASKRLKIASVTSPLASGTRAYLAPYNVRFLSDFHQLLERPLNLLKSSQGSEALGLGREDKISKIVGDRSLRLDNQSRPVIRDIELCPQAGGLP
jgi:hypothetical protein